MGRLGKNILLLWGEVYGLPLLRGFDNLWQLSHDAPRASHNLFDEVARVTDVHSLYRAIWYAHLIVTDATEQTGQEDVSTRAIMAVNQNNLC
jgi:hypothetical protein